MGKLLFTAAITQVITWTDLLCNMRNKTIWNWNVIAICFTFRTRLLVPPRFWLSSNNSIPSRLLFLTYSRPHLEPLPFHLTPSLFNQSPFSNPLPLLKIIHLALCTCVFFPFTGAVCSEMAFLLHCLLLLLVLLLILPVSCIGCPSGCRCYSLTVECGSIGLKEIPRGIAQGTQVIVWKRARFLHNTIIP